MSTQLESALISAGVSILVFTLGELFLRQRKRQDTRQEILATYRKYAEPLTLSTTDLFWRLREVFNDEGAGFYLKGRTHLTKFERYKALSTLYRMANLLAWIRALRRELFFIPGANPAAVEKLDSALRSFGSALAEGGHVESRRVEALMRLWDMHPECTPRDITRAGIRIDHELKNFLHEMRVSSARSLAVEDQLALSRRVSRALTEGLRCTPVGDGVLGETLNRTVNCLAIREAWIYRDWQAAIGDLMLRNAQPGPRQFEVLGYKDFEAICESGEEGDLVWLRRLYSVIDDLDIAGDQSGDARIDQLREAYIATAKIIEALHSADTKRSRTSPATWNAVSGVLMSE